MSASTDAQLVLFARSMRAAREAFGVSREAVVYELTKLGNPVSLSSLARWEKEGTIKAEDAWYLSQVYGITIDELLLSRATNGAAAASAPTDARSELSDEVAVAGDARRLDRQPRQSRRQAKRRPASGEGR